MGRVRTVVYGRPAPMFAIAPSHAERQIRTPSIDLCSVTRSTPSRALPWQRAVGCTLARCRRSGRAAHPTKKSAAPAVEPP